MQDPRSKQEGQIGEKDKANRNIRWPISDSLCFYFSYLFGSWILVLGSWFLVISSFKRMAI